MKPNHRCHPAAGLPWRASRRVGGIWQHGDRGVEHLVARRLLELPKLRLRPVAFVGDQPLLDAASATGTLPSGPACPAHVQRAHTRSDAQLQASLPESEVFVLTDEGLRLAAAYRSVSDPDGEDDPGEMSLKLV